MVFCTGSRWQVVYTPVVYTPVLQIDRLEAGLIIGQSVLRYRGFSAWEC
jgi:hypothetical protein